MFFLLQLLSESKFWHKVFVDKTLQGDFLIEGQQEKSPDGVQTLVVADDSSQMERLGVDGEAAGHAKQKPAAWMN